MLEEDRREVVLPPPMMRAVPTSAWLMPVGSGPHMGYPLNRPCTLIGRDVGNDIMINSSSVSRTHAQIVRMEGCWLVLDLDSKNGTFVNGDLVVQQQLFDGDRLSIGSIQYLLGIQQPPDARLPEVPLTPIEPPEKPAADPNLGDTLG
ncbi:MAG: FHA domain-containing protein [Candidatus Xenobia bacterium]